MIQIIKMGEGCETYFKTIKCEYCGTIFKATKADINGTRRDGREFDVDHVMCPICGEDVDFERTVLD